MTSIARSIYRTLWGALLTVSFIISGGFLPAQAERGHGYERDRFYSPHWELDIRHGHDHYYPARGYLVPRLPPGYLDLTFGGGHFFFRSGVWYRAQGPQFVVVRPPVGIRLGLLPPSYSTIWIGGMPYYYANGIYYTAVPNTTEYAVVNPPPGYETAMPQPAPAQVPSLPPPAPVSPPVAPAASLPQALFIYPREGQTPSEIAGDRRECNEWATGQTGYDPARPSTGSAQRVGDFQRAVRTCLEGKGYTVN
ncbi:MAG: hypothetical protein HY038_02375 [Nitrospirae bacterium]|nr:hypothetical protein [Nitrospirota bacterium]